MVVSHSGCAGAEIADVRWGAHAGMVNALAFDETDSLIASAGDDGRVVLFSPGSVGARTRQINLALHTAGVLGVGFIPGKRALVTSGRRVRSRSGAGPTGRLERPSDRRRGRVRGLAFSGDGRSLRMLTATPNFRVRSDHSPRVAGVAADRAATPG